jgi:hypothetical protein
MSPQEKHHGVMAQIRTTSDLTIKMLTLYHWSYSASHIINCHGVACLVCTSVYFIFLQILVMPDIFRVEIKEIK